MFNRKQGALHACEDSISLIAFLLERCFYQLLFAPLEILLPLAELACRRSSVLITISRQLQFELRAEQSVSVNVTNSFPSSATSHVTSFRVNYMSRTQPYCSYLFAEVNFVSTSERLQRVVVPIDSRSVSIDVTTPYIGRSSSQVDYNRNVFKLLHS